MELIRTQLVLELGDHSTPELLDEEDDEHGDVLPMVILELEMPRLHIADTFTLEHATVAPLHLQPIATAIVRQSDGTYVQRILTRIDDEFLTLDEYLVYGVLAASHGFVELRQAHPVYQMICNTLEDWMEIRPVVPGPDHRLN